MSEVVSAASSGSPAHSAANNPELNPSNVFAFGLHSSYSAFAPDAANSSAITPAANSAELLNGSNSAADSSLTNNSNAAHNNSNPEQALLNNPMPAMDFNPYFFMNNINLNLNNHNNADISHSNPNNQHNTGDLSNLGLNYLSGPNRGPHHLNMNPMAMNPMNLMNMNPSVCKFFAAGHCARGDQCNYAHINPNQPHSANSSTNPAHLSPTQPPPGLLPQNPGQKPYRGRNRPDMGHNGPNFGPNFHPRHGGMNNYGPPMNPMFNPMNLHGFSGQNNGHNNGRGGMGRSGYNNRNHQYNQHNDRNHHRNAQNYQQPLLNMHPNNPNNISANANNPLNIANSAQTGQSSGSVANPSAALANSATNSTGSGEEAANSASNSANQVPQHPQFNPFAANQSPSKMGLVNDGPFPFIGAPPGGLNVNLGGLAGLDPSFLAAAAMQNSLQFNPALDPNSTAFDPAAASFFHANLSNSVLTPPGLGLEIGLTASAEDLIGRVYALSRDQYGCRLLQRLLDERRLGVIDVVYAESFEHINELMTDPFGNYLCQKLIEHSNETPRLAILHRVAPDLVAISLNLHGTRAVQKLVESISSPAEIELLINSLRSSVVTLIKDLNGNHVIQRALHHLNSNDNQFIYDAVSRHCVSVATHKHGCCVLQRCIDYATVNQKRQLVNEIISSSLELVQDAFGNYVVQYVLDLGEPNTSNQIIANLLGHISSLSVQKFSSNVIEKCLELANDKMRGKVVDELINLERLPRLLQDPYANYVIQKALSVSKKSHLDRLVQVIKPHLGSLKNTAFGKRIQNKISKKFPDLEAENGLNSTQIGQNNANNGDDLSPGDDSSDLLNNLNLNNEFSSLNLQGISPNTSISNNAPTSSSGGNNATASESTANNSTEVTAP
jgi:hypothetical protein